MDKKKPSMRPSASSSERYSDTTEGCSRADPMLAEAGRRRVPCPKPILKPNFSPVQMSRANAASGWWDRARAQASTTNGVATVWRPGQ